ncbi:UNVERIFIED_CONTAM: hypothetical protein FKN15_017191 [Acipenser sinensis]
MERFISSLLREAADRLENTPRSQSPPPTNRATTARNPVDGFSPHTEDRIQKEDKRSHSSAVFVYITLTTSAV